MHLIELSRLIIRRVFCKFVGAPYWPVKGGIHGMESVGGSSAEQLAGEFDNFEEIARGIMPRPGSIPSLIGMEVYGETLPLNGIVDGDHLIYVDIKKCHDHEARIKVAEDAGRPDIAAS